MPRTAVTALSALVVTVTAATAPAAILLVNDNFDSYADQAAFQAKWPTIGTGPQPSAILSTAQSKSSPQSVLQPTDTTSAAGSANYRNRRTLSEAGTTFETGVPTATKDLIWSFDFYDGNAANAPYRNYANLQDTTAPTGTNQLVSMGLNNNQIATNSGGNYYMARILGYSPAATDPDGGPGETGTLGSGAYFKLNDLGVGTRSTGWHNLKVLITTNDGLSTDYYFYVDNVLAERVLNVGTTASLRSYDNIVIGSGLTNSSTSISNLSYIDNMVLSIPEPASLSLVGAAAAMLRRRRR